MKLCEACEKREATHGVRLQLCYICWVKYVKSS